MTRAHVPQEILDAAHARKAARLAGEWAEADRLRVVIEAAGWRVVDHGLDFALSSAHAPDLVVGDRVLYGSSEGVPSRLGEPSTAAASVIVCAADQGAAVRRVVTGLFAHAPSATQFVLVADAPSTAVAAVIEGLQAMGEPRLEVTWTATRLGHGAAINVGLRRAIGAVAILLDASIEPVGDIVTPLCAALEDPTTALVGGGGMVGTDIRYLVDQAAGDVAALDGSCLALRRTDAVGRGPMDEHFRVPRLLGTWWSLVLRDSGPDHPPRRAVAIVDLPIVRHSVPGDDLDPADRERMLKRDRYRLLDAFRDRPDLLSRAAP